MAFDVARILLGLVFVLFGLNGFFSWWPLPKMNPEMMKFNDSLQATRIIMPVVKSFEVVFGLLLLVNQFTLIATLALLPVVFFIALAHVCFNRPKGLVMAGLFVILTAILVHHHWRGFADLLFFNV